jgi:hypothetical protein
MYQPAAYCIYRADTPVLVDHGGIMPWTMVDSGIIVIMHRLCQPSEQLPSLTSQLGYFRLY